jgi:GT2 family glycosyltransferase
VTPRLGVVIVHWGDPAETLGCVDSLGSTRAERVVVVDNGTPAPLATSRAPGVEVLRLPQNRGYAGGANAGIARVLDAGADVVLVLNNDARLTPGAAAAAMAGLATDDRIAVTGARVVTREDPSRLWLAWGDVTYHQSLVALHGADVPDAPAWRTARDVDWVAGCALWLRAAALRDVGLFDEAFFAYHEEVDWCTRARRSGWRVVYWPDAVVSHTGRGSHGGAASVRIRKYFAARNAVLFARKHAARRERLTFAAWLAASLPLELAYHAMLGSATDVVWKLRGVRDALAGREPPFARLLLR